MDVFKKYILEDTKDSTGKMVPTLFKLTVNSETNIEVHREAMGDVEDFEELFNTCALKWLGNWDLNKVCTAIRESEIE